MLNDSWFKQLDSVLSNSFNNLKYDTREIFRLINEIKNILIEAEPLEVKNRITVIENSLQDHVAAVKKIESHVSDMRNSIQNIKPSDNKELVSVFRKVKGVLIQNQKSLDRLARTVEKLAKSDSDRKKEMKELKSLAKNLEKEVKKKPKMIKVPVKVPMVKKAVKAKTAAKSVRAKPARVRSKPAGSAVKTTPYISSAQFQAKRKEDLNSEWVEVSGKEDMTGWMIQDKKRKHTYNFPKGFMLNGKVKIHSGTGNNTNTQLYWDNKRPIWNDDSDVAVLKNSKKVIVSRARSERIHDFSVLKSNNMINITSVQFEGAGSDRDANGEWVEITGSGRMGSWTLEDQDKKHVYTFPTGFVLNGKAKIFSGHGTNTDTKLFWGNPNPVWNDDHDICTLRHKDGDIVSQIESKAIHNFEVLK